MAAKIRQNDEVIMLTGSAEKGKGKRGKVTKVLSNGKVIVEGLNMVSKHEKPVPALGKAGGIVKKEAAIDVSNVAIYNPSTNKADRVGFRFEDGKKVRFFKSTGETIK
ncbi:50S ribosomal protein L24 [Chelonobacter oris]|uniref:Large ribosomal subunit protein uL24 n=1 Tax=Chelonobacter oris TaxID=505317 RepID=A0A0A3BA93_9PAST|nr:50S ribosomal protein L24 [Chelonobacter oris]KGQ70489.1 50S ribosomal protein L24 [Chelonobacter oris]MDH3000530.1 50S ribosomal protein L24 [Chelonobacter oris]